MATIHVWGGGPYHTTQTQAEWLRQQVEQRGHAMVYDESLDLFEPDALARADLFILMGLSWTGMGAIEASAWQAPATPQPYRPLSDAQMQALLDYLAAGKPLWCHHAAICSFDDRPKLEEVFDGRWVWGRSDHPPIHEFTVRVVGPAHPLTVGLSDFQITDELYHHLNGPQHSQILLEADYEGRAWPLAWAGNYPTRKGGPARVAYTALGHDMRAYGSSALQRLTVNVVDWLLALEETNDHVEDQRKDQAQKN